MKSSTIPSSSSKRRSLIESASKTFAVFDRPRSRKERLSDGERAGKVKISPPYDFRDLSNNSSSSGISQSDNNLDSIKEQSNPIDPQACFSPQNKPLPSLPVATIMTDSPVKTKRLLIDAEERPLRRSVSPTQNTLEDWPSLSPQKQRDITPTNKVPTPVKPSISEGLAERIKQLNLNDKAAKEPDRVESVHPQTSPTDPRPVRATRATPNSKSQVPEIRHNKASRLRLGISAGNVADQKQQKKTNPPSPPLTASSDASTRARPLKRVDATPRSRLVPRSRSRSRHRVTAEGSPYVLSQKSAKPDRCDLGRKSSLVLDASRIDTNFTETGSQAPQIKTDSVDKSIVEEHRKSSIPLPKRLRPPLQDVNNGVRMDVEQNAQGSVSDSFSETVVDNLDLSNTRCTHNDTPHQATWPQSCVLSSPSSTIDEEYEIRPVSRNSAGRGPTLRISPRADEFLLGVGSNFEAVEKDIDVAKRSSLISLESSGLIPRSLSLSKTVDKSTNRVIKAGRSTKLPEVDELPTSDQGLQSDQQHKVPQAHTIPRKAVSSEHRVIPDKRNIEHATTTSAPPIKPGAPKDDSRTNGWPFRESAIAPFKTSTTPDRNIGWNARSITGSNRSSNTSSQTGLSSGHSVRSRYAIGEALTRVTPIEKTTKQSFSLVNTTAETHEAVVSSDDIAVFPPRSSSRIDQPTPLTGVRKRSIPSHGMATSKYPALHTPTVPRSTPLAQNRDIKSAPHSTYALPKPTSAGDHVNSKPLPPPMPVANPVSTSKGVLKNIRTLFHKRSNLHVSLHNPLHRSQRNEQGSVSSMKSMSTRVTTTPAASSQIPRSPQVKGTSSLAGRTPTSRMFPVNRSVRPFASSSPVEPETETTPISTPSGSKPKLNSRAPTQPSEIKGGTSTTTEPHAIAPTLEPAYLTTATALVYTLLDLVQNDPSATHNKREQLIELSKVLVDVLAHARDVEKALEAMKGQVVKCEMRAMEVRGLVERVEELVRGVGMG